MRFRLKKLDESGFDHVAVVTVFVVIFALIGAYFLFTSLAATTYVELHIGNSGGACVDGGSLSDCSTSNKSGLWVTLSGSNFQIKNQAGQCLDDWNGAVGTNSNNRVSLRTNNCYSGDANQEWSWVGSGIHQLESAGSKAHGGGCINALGGSESAGTSLIIYSCNTQNNEKFFETSAGSSSSGGGGSTTATCAHTGQAGQDVANCAMYQLSYWNSHPSDHQKLIDTYCDGNGACEGGEWCAGFVSYVYKAAGYPIGDVFLATNFENLANHFTFQSKAALGAIQVDNGAGGGHAQIVVKTSPIEFVSGNWDSSVVYTADPGSVVYGYAVYKQVNP